MKTEWPKERSRTHPCQSSQFQCQWWSEGPWAWLLWKHPGYGWTHAHSQHSQMSADLKHEIYWWWTQHKSYNQVMQTDTSVKLFAFVLVFLWDSLWIYHTTFNLTFFDKSCSFSIFLKHFYSTMHTCTIQYNNT